jgi:hypothetical protein
MDLLRRYLQAVGTYLPKSQQDDILKELGRISARRWKTKSLNSDVH